MTAVATFRAAFAEGGWEILLETDYLREGHATQKGEEWRWG